MKAASLTADDPRFVHSILLHVPHVLDSTKLVSTGHRRSA